MSSERQPEHCLNEKEFRFICNLVYESTGIVLDDRKREMVYRRLMRRTRELNMTSFSTYCRLLEDEASGELPNFINAITTNLTSFFREQHHFKYLRDHFIPRHLGEFAGARRMRCWSAGCSTGEEAYSLAMTLVEGFGSALPAWDVKVLATDLDTNVLATARAGIYSEERLKDISNDLRKRWFRYGKGAQEGLVKVNEALGTMITFKQLNLLEAWPMRGPFDVIFCRNVMIYFDKSTQRELVERFSALLRPGGVLMIGHSESITKDSAGLAIKGRTIFEKERVTCAQGRE